MSHARVKAADLRLHVFDRSIHPELYDVVRRVELRGEHWSADLVITSQGHVIAFRAGGETLTEVFAPAGAALPRIGARASVAIRRDAGEELRRDEGAIRYAASLRVATHPPAEYRRAAGALIQDDPMERIKVFFDLAGEDDLTPFALMDFRRWPSGITVASVHACPAELAIIQIETRIETAT